MPFDVIVEDAGGASVTLVNLLAGDVWVCSGQSNMKLSINEMFEADAVIANSAALSFALVRREQDLEQQTPQVIIEAQYEGGWVEASPTTVCGARWGAAADYCQPHCGPSAQVPSFKRPTWGYFSAVCFAHGIELLRATGRPQGLLETSWGGTQIERWSSGAALAVCRGNHSHTSKSDGEGIPSLTEPPATTVAADPDDSFDGGSASGLWNGMVVPLLPLPIRGVVWYQGEANNHAGMLVL